MGTSANRFALRKQTTPAANPFEEKWRLSHRSTIRKRATSKAVARAQSGRNSFFDKRIGEADPTLDEENRYLYRLQRERARKVSTRFALDDDEGTHGDVDVDDARSDENNSEPADSDDNDGEEFLKVKSKLSENAVASEEEEEEASSKKTKQEVMEEVIQKSKMYKAQRQQEKHVSDQQTEQLDGKLQDIMSLLERRCVDVASKEKGSDLRISGQKDEKLSNGFIETRLKYESLYRELEREKRARPSQRLLTEGEKAEMEREKLAELERKRKARMQNIDSEDEEDSNTLEKRPKAAHSPKSTNEKNPPIPATDDSVPYVFEKCPATEQELEDVLKSFTTSQIRTVLDRIRKCFAVSLNVDNAKKLEVLAICALHRIETLARGFREPDITLSEIDLLCSHVWMTRNSGFGKESAASTKAFIRAVSSWATAKIVSMHEKLISASAGLSSAWGVGDIILLRVIARLFPCSDLRHPISTPLLLMLSYALRTNYMMSLADMALGTFVASIVLEATFARNGYSGGIGNFCRNVLLLFVPEATVHTSRQLAPLRGLKLHSLVEEGPSFPDGKGPISLTEVNTLIGTPTHSDSTAKKRKSSDVFMTNKLLSSIARIIEILGKRGMAVDILLSSIPIKKLYRRDVYEQLACASQESRKNRAPLALYGASERGWQADRHKPGLKLLNPKYTAESGVFRKRPRTSYHARNSDISASAKRVKRALRKEERGLVRDYRRDAIIAANRKAEEDQVRNEKRDERDRAVRGFLENQRSTWRAAEKKQKKLSGKRW